MVESSQMEKDSWDEVLNEQEMLAELAADELEQFIEETSFLSSQLMQREASGEEGLEEDIRTTLHLWVFGMREEKRRRDEAMGRHPTRKVENIHGPYFGFEN